MNINELRTKLKPKLHETDLEGFKVYVHAPAGRDVDKCTDTFQTVIYCVKDENGDPIFSDEDVDGRINVKSIEFQHVVSLSNAVFDLMKNQNVVEDIEKK